MGVVTYVHALCRTVFCIIPGNGHGDRALALAVGDVCQEAGAGAGVSE